MLSHWAYADKPQTLDHLEDNILRVIADIRPYMLEKVIENWTSRLDYIRASRGSPMPEIIFEIKTNRFIRNARQSTKTKKTRWLSRSILRLDSEKCAWLVTFLRVATSGGQLASLDNG
ncbi:hypothetical protein TNCV_2006941 [Trichonephila clavipes]|nr:hypothetical protein TNCV_2006941 [Trichonephila clavipes]